MSPGRATKNRGTWASPWAGAVSEVRSRRRPKEQPLGSCVGRAHLPRGVEIRDGARFERPSHAGRSSGSRMCRHLGDGRRLLSMLPSRSQCRLEVVFAYRCGAALDLHQVPFSGADVLGTAAPPACICGDQNLGEGLLGDFPHVRESGRSWQEKSALDLGAREDADPRCCGSGRRRKWRPSSQSCVSP